MNFMFDLDLECLIALSSDQAELSLQQVLLQPRTDGLLARVRRRAVEAHVGDHTRRGVPGCVVRVDDLGQRSAPTIGWYALLGKHLLNGTVEALDLHHGQ